MVNKNSHNVAIEDNLLHVRIYIYVLQPLRVKLSHDVCTHE